MSGNTLWALGGILALSLLLRFFHLNRLSLWYDEVVSMRLARTPDPSALVRLLDRIDATRAPLHPLVLQAWLRYFGTSDFAGRSLSALCGVATVALVFWLGRNAYDSRTGLWAAWLTAWSPVLVRYSQEVRMYAWLVVMTALAWGFLFALRRGPSLRNLLGLAFSTVALIYTHPLGLLMAAALALASLLNRRALGLSWKTWIAVQLLIALAAAPWLPRYLDHPPEYEVGKLPLRFLIGVPIGFIGGNAWVLLATGGLILFGATAIRKGEGRSFRLVIDDAPTVSCLLIWFMVPPVLLYIYSAVAHPVFGPARYTLFVAPAYLLLVARGLAKLKLGLALIMAGGGAVLSALLLATIVYAPDLKADWRAAARFLDREARGVRLVVSTTDEKRNFEIENAQYYLAPGRPIISVPAVWDKGLAPAWLSVALRRGTPVKRFATEPLRENGVVDFPGLRLIELR